MKPLFDKDTATRCTPAQCIELVDLAHENGVPIHNETLRYPYDRQFPCLLWKDFSQSIEQCTKSYNATFIPFDDFKQAIIEYGKQKITTLYLSSGSKAKITYDGIKIIGDKLSISDLEKIIEIAKGL